jgi:hypothetical protein
VAGDRSLSAADCGDRVRLRSEPSARTLGWGLVPYEECNVGEGDCQRSSERLRFHMLERDGCGEPMLWVDAKPGDLGRSVRGSCEGDDMDQDNLKSGRDVGPLTGLARTRAKLKAGQIADLERRKAALLARREIIDRDISALEAKLNELREGAE